MIRCLRTHLAVLALSLALPALAADPAPVPQGPPPKWIEPRAEELLRRMSDRLAGSPRFALEAEETFDEIPEGEPRRSLTNVRRVAVVRPNRLAADAVGDTLNRAVWYDGHTFSVLDKAHNTWARIEAPPTIDAALDLIAERYHVEVPLADLIFADPYAVLFEGVRYGRYLGIHLAAGVPCHHLAFAQDSIEWQIWIDAGGDPLPRRIAITYVKEPGEPQYTATIRKWNFAPKFSDTLFHFEPPEGARRMELRGGAVKAGGAPGTVPATLAPATLVPATRKLDPAALPAGSRSKEIR